MTHFRFSLLTLAALLVPWTVLLALADGRHWFGDDSVKWAWVAFDMTMVVALSGLGLLVRAGRSAARPLAFGLAGATATDFVLTTVQALNLHQDLGGLEGLFVLAGMGGPLLATGLLVLLGLVAPLERRRRRDGLRGYR